MDSQISQLLISLITGGVGGNIAGALLKQFSLGTLGNTAAGLLGGGIGGQILSSVLGGGTPPGLAGNIVGSGVGGMVVMVIIGLVKSAMRTKTRT